jgi:hypothetical protein
MLTRVNVFCFALLVHGSGDQRHRAVVLRCRQAAAHPRHLHLVWRDLEVAQEDQDQR